MVASMKLLVKKLYSYYERRISFQIKKAGKQISSIFLNLYYVALIFFVFYALNARVKHLKRILRDRNKHTEHVAPIFRYPRLSCN